MSNKYYYIILLIIINYLIISNAIVTEGRNKKLKEDIERIEQEYRNFIRTNIRSTETVLSASKVEYRNVIVFQIFYQDCPQCIDSVLSAINDLDFDIDNILLIHNYFIDREIGALINKFNLSGINILNDMESEHYDDINGRKSKSSLYYIDRQCNMRFLFFPTKFNIIETKIYLAEMRNIL